MLVDLGHRITPEICDQVLLKICSKPAASPLSSSPALLVISRFEDRLAAPACRAAFKSACSMGDLRYMAMCLEHTADRLDLSVMGNDLKTRCLLSEPRVAIPTIRVYRNSIDRAHVSTIIDNKWYEREMMQALIYYCRDKIDVQAIGKVFYPGILHRGP